MSTKIFVNLPVKDLKKSMDLFKALGYSFNPQFSDDTAACLVISPDIFAMLLTHPKFQEFTPQGRQIADATKVTEVLVALSADSKAQVDSLMAKALTGGGSEARPAQDLGFMYSRCFSDPDGHVWELVWMDPAALQS